MPCRSSWVQTRWRRASLAWAVPSTGLSGLRCPGLGTATGNARRSGTDASVDWHPALARTFSRPPHHVMVGGVHAHRVRGGRRAREEIRLAPAPPEVYKAPGAPAARVGHPLEAAEPVEGGRLIPDPGEAGPEDRGGIQVGDDGGHGAGERCPVRRDREERPPPSVHARFREVGIVVGDDPKDLQRRAGLLAERPDGALCGFDRFPRREEDVPVKKGPSVILSVGQFHAARPEGGGELLVPTLPPGNLPAEGGVGGLEAQLHAPQPGVPEGPCPFLREADAARDEIGVQLPPSGALYQVREVPAEERLTPGEVDLQDPEVGRLIQDIQPRRGGELPPAGHQVHGIGAVKTVKRAPVREFAQEGERGSYRPAHWIHRRAAAVSINSRTSASTSACGYRRLSSATSSGTVRVPSHSPRISAAVSFRKTARSGRRRTIRCRAGS